MNIKKLLVITVFVIGITTSGYIAFDYLFNPEDPTNVDTSEHTDENITVTWIETGQSSSILIQSPNSTVLFDSGSWQSDGEDVRQYLESNNIERIDSLIASHPDADHIGGHNKIIEEYGNENIGSIYDPGLVKNTHTFEEYINAVDDESMTIKNVEDGDEIPFDGGHLKVLNPPRDEEFEQVNDNSIVLLLQHHNNTFLLTGDIEREGEAHLAENYDLENVDVMHAPHHGSMSSSQKYFVENVDPDHVVFASPLDSPHGHPHDMTVTTYNTIGSKLYWTGLHGNIQFISSPDGISVQKQYDKSFDLDKKG